MFGGTILSCLFILVFIVLHNSASSIPPPPQLPSGAIDPRNSREIIVFDGETPFDPEKYQRGSQDGTYGLHLDNMDIAQNGETMQLFPTVHNALNHKLSTANITVKFYSSVERMPQNLLGQVTFHFGVLRANEEKKFSMKVNARQWEIVSCEYWWPK